MPAIHAALSSAASPNSISPQQHQKEREKRRKRIYKGLGFGGHWSRVDAMQVEGREREMRRVTEEIPNVT